MFTNKINAVELVNSLREAGAFNVSLRRLMPTRVRDGKTARERAPGGCHGNRFEHQAKRAEWQHSNQANNNTWPLNQASPN